MADIKVIWGPLGTERHPDRLVWKFHGLRTNGNYARWHLAFWLDSRRFTTKPMLASVGDDDRAQKLSALPVNTPPLTGAVTPMLRARLKPEHVAEAMRLALAYRRR